MRIVINLQPNRLSALSSIQNNIVVFGVVLNYCILFPCVNQILILDGLPLFSWNLSIMKSVHLRQGVRSL